jgi:predicted enzyme related to lactoylglutathione lyase
MRVTVVLDCHDADALVPFWEAALDYRLNEALDEYRVLVSRTQVKGAPVLVLAQVDDAKLGKNRMHLDTHPEDAEAHIAHLQRLGATLAGERVERFGAWWQTMHDPEGNEFCVMSGAQGPDEGGEGF